MMIEVSWNLIGGRRSRIIRVEELVWYGIVIKYM